MNSNWEKDLKQFNSSSGVVTTELKNKVLNRLEKRERISLFFDTIKSIAATASLCVTIIGLFVIYNSPDLLDKEQNAAIEDSKHLGWISIITTNSLFEEIEGAGISVSATAGRTTTSQNTNKGQLIVTIYKDGKVTDKGQYFVPSKHGALTINHLSGTTLYLESEDGRQWTFDIHEKEFVALEE